MSVTEIDLKLISGAFLFDDLPSNKEYLRYYFSGFIPNRFLVYYLNFRSLGKTHTRRLVEGFADHTGIYCKEQLIYKLVRKIQRIESAVEEAQAAMDLETLATIKLGQKKI